MNDIALGFRSAALARTPSSLMEWFPPTYSTLGVSLREKPSTVPSSRVLAAAEMRSYADLFDGWDGPGSVAPKRELIDRALAVLDAIPDSVLMPEAGASADGTVEWSWRTPQGAAIITIWDSSTLSFYAEASQDSIKGRLEPGDPLPAGLVAILRRL